jgi:integrase
MVYLETKDHRGERRVIRKRFRYDEYDDPLEEALSLQEEVENGLDSLEWCREKWPNPKNPEKAFIVRRSIPPPQTWTAEHVNEDPRSIWDGKSLRQWVTGGMVRDERGNWKPSDDPSVSGWLYRCHERKGHSHYKRHRATWGHLEKWHKDQPSRPLDRPLMAIEPDTLESFGRWMEKQTKADGTSYARETIRGYVEDYQTMILQWAIQVDVRSPLSRSSWKPSRVEGKPPTQKIRRPEVLDAVEDAIAKRTGKAYSMRIAAPVIWQIQRWGGLRSEEISALRVGDFTFREDGVAEIKVNKSWTRDDGLKRTKGGQLSGGSGERLVTLRREAAQIVFDWIESRRSDALVFPNSGGHSDREYITSRQIRRQYVAASKDAGIDPAVTPHQLRHSLNSWLRSRGIDKGARMAQLGHLSEDVNDDYTNPRSSEILEVM